MAVHPHTTHDAAGTTGADHAILAASGELLRIKAEMYAFDDRPDDERPSEEAEKAADDAMIVQELVLEKSRASTPAGVACRLQMLLSRLDQSRWVDRTLAEQGFDALYEQRDEMEFDALQVAEAIFDLRQMDPLRCFAEAWLDRWTALGGSVGISTEGMRFKVLPEPDCWVRQRDNPLLAPHQQISSPEQLEGAAKALDGIARLIPGASDAIWAAAVARGIALGVEG